MELTMASDGKAREGNAFSPERNLHVAHKPASVEETSI